MSINSALLAGASGLISNSSALAAISDNIANVNTVGYKRANSVFTPLYDAGGSNNRSIGLQNNIKINRTRFRSRRLHEPWWDS